MPIATSVNHAKPDAESLGQFMPGVSDEFISDISKIMTNTPVDQRDGVMISYPCAVNHDEIMYATIKWNLAGDDTNRAVGELASAANFPY